MAAGVIAATLAPGGAHAQSPEEFWRRNNITLTIADRKSTRLNSSH